MRVLHITNWYAEPRLPHRVPFIVEHIAALEQYVDQQLWHVEVQEGAWSWRRGVHNQALILVTPLASWQLREWLTLLLLVRLRLLLWRGGWDLVVVHIAYPLLRFPHLVKLLFGRSLLLIEHWSAYHTNFQLPPASPALRRLQGMFASGIPVVAVSQALAADIRCFASRPNLAVTVVPNAVDTSLFHAGLNVPLPPSPTFLMVANWAPIKQPLLVLSAIRGLISQWPQLRLRVIGGGVLLPIMQEYIDSYGLNEIVQLLGPQPKCRIAREMRRSTAFLHPSAYETFSVVCAEALCCGVPVLASAVGAIPELITPKNGLLVANTPEAWSAALRQVLNDPPAWDRLAMAKQAASKFSRLTVGRELMMAMKRAMCQDRGAMIENKK